METGHPPYLSVWITVPRLPLISRSRSGTGLFPQNTVSLARSGARRQPFHPGAFLEGMGFGLI